MGHDIYIALLSKTLAVSYYHRLDPAHACSYLLTPAHAVTRSIETTSKVNYNILRRLLSGVSGGEITPQLIERRWLWKVHDVVIAPLCHSGVNLGNWALI